MTDTNVVTVIGRLTKDAELKYGGVTVGFFNIATNRKKKDSNTGDYVEESSFFDVNVYGKYAEKLAPSLKKGTVVCVVGELKQDRWTDSKGQQKSRVTIAANSIQIVGGRTPHE